MNIVHAEYNKYHNIIDINYYNGYILRIDCGKAEDGLITTPNSQRMLDALAIDNPLEYARLYLDSEMQDWVNAMNMEWCIFRKNRALAPHERGAVPLGTDHCPVG